MFPNLRKHKIQKKLVSSPSPIPLLLIPLPFSLLGAQAVSFLCKVSLRARSKQSEQGQMLLFSVLQPLALTFCSLLCSTLGKKK